MKHLNNQRGVSIYIAVVITAVLLGIALGLSTTFLTQVETLRGVGKSVFAFYAAEAGIERVLFIDASICASVTPLVQRINCIRDEINNLSSSDKTLGNGASYEVIVEDGGDGVCPAGTNYCVKSIGEYKQANRAIRVKR